MQLHVCFLRIFFLRIFLQPLCIGKTSSKSFYLCLCILCSLFVLAPQAVAASLEKNIVQEELKAKDRRANLQRLTANERTLNANLAKTEKRILDIEGNLEKLQKELATTFQKDTNAEQEYNKILAEQKETLAIQQDVARLLWEIVVKRESTGSRDMLDWDSVDREHRWSLELFGALEKHRATLAEQEHNIKLVLLRRDRYARDAKENVEKANAEKTELLKNQLQYTQKLDTVRSQKKTAEQELQEIITIIDNLNFQMAEAGDTITKQKGNLLWPVDGNIQKNYAPNANPPYRGVGFAAKEGSPVRAIAAGKVVHNDILRGFGTVLILQHDKDYYSLYAFLGQSPLQIGGQVKKSERIGSVGFYPDIHASGMYFELRHKQKAVNPKQWLSS